jgi:hypothetical protein
MFDVAVATQTACGATMTAWAIPLMAALPITEPVRRSIRVSRELLGPM